MVQNRQQTHDCTLIGSGANGIGKQVCSKDNETLLHAGFPNVGGGCIKVRQDGMNLSVENFPIGNILFIIGYKLVGGGGGYSQEL